MCPTTPCSGCEPVGQLTHNSEILGGWLAPLMVIVRRLRAHTMSEHPFQPCPRCKTTDRVRRKLITFVREWGQSVSVGDLGSGHLTVSSPDGQGGEQHSGSFLNGFHCDACGIGFVPDSVLREVGLTEREILSGRIFAPEPLDRYGP